jgi:hypothetical protein
MSKSFYQPKYSSSWALLVGINDYIAPAASPLEYARNDAEVVSKTLIDRFGFEEENVTTLFDENATRQNIMERFLHFTKTVGEEDRVFVFYAGHGMTLRTNKDGEVGYLVPHDGDPENIATLIRWDELTRNSDLIPAKHMFFVMDACYGGLAVTRNLQPGSTRFLKDMLQRYSRQVLTAGKADEVVADAGGPRPSHSVFTGHLLNGLEGDAASNDGVITANGLMSFVYDKVAKDQYSKQTPHYGFIDGDGDFIFNVPDFPGEGHETGSNAVVSVPGQSNKDSDEVIADDIKSMIALPASKIKLHDRVVAETRNVLSRLNSDEFSPSADYSGEEFLERLGKYEDILNGLTIQLSCIAHWGDESHISILTKSIERIAGAIDQRGGKNVWLALRWYPVELLHYSSGIAAIAANNFASLKAVLRMKCNDKTSRHGAKLSVLDRVTEAMLDLRRSKAFKNIPGKERNYEPRSEHLFERVQPLLDDLLFLGESYEHLFDQFEILKSLVYMDEVNRSWALAGRFGWKDNGRFSDSGPLSDLIAEIENQKNDWPPLANGLFSNLDEVNQLATNLREHVRQLNWF